VVAVFLLIYFAGAKARFDIYFERYILTEQRDPAGVVARLMMNAAPATLFLLRNKIYDLPPAPRTLWLWLSIFALCMFPMLIFLPSPIIVDRFSIYFTPIQMVAYSGYVEAAARRRFPFRAFHVPALLVLYGVAFWVWLNLGVRSDDWLPYRNVAIGFLS
ncbi:MAG TPA: EpsG family protein, partial [Phenylobacterium sp.]|nr:EpsG family protein [Phenylobacterium sp.]